MPASIGTISCSGRGLSATGGTIPTSLESKITEDFGSVEAFKEAFKTAATTQFGSGWAWLVLGTDGKLKVTKTPNGSNPFAEDAGKALIGLDVWEHSYYLDFQNRRPDYVTNFLDKLCELRVRRRPAEGGLTPLA